MSRAWPDTLASDNFLSPLQEMGIKEAHPERSYHCRGVQEEERELQIGNVSKAVLRPTPGHEANTTDNTRGNAGEEPEEDPFMQVEELCRKPRDRSRSRSWRSSPVPNTWVPKKPRSAAKMRV